MFDSNPKDKMGQQASFLSFSVKIRKLTFYKNQDGFMVDENGEVAICRDDAGSNESSNQIRSDMKISFGLGGIIVR